MNIERAQTLLGQLERLLDEQFTMGEWIDHPTQSDPLGCKTTACVAGWCSLLNGGPSEGSRHVAEWAEEWLDLTHPEYHRLFFAKRIIGGRPLSQVSRAEMVEELRRMIDEAKREVQETYDALGA